jgi:hypothetical protein
MFMKSARRPALAAASTLLAATLLLGGCAATTITASSNPSRDPAWAWADYAVLPVTVLGSAGNHSQASLSSLFPAAPSGAGGEGRHIVMYVNASALPPATRLCSDTSGFHPGAQNGDAANVTGAMCNGSAVVTTSTGRVLTHVQSARWLKHDFDVIRDQLYQSLFPGANDPSNLRA